MNTQTTKPWKATVKAMRTANIGTEDITEAIKGILADESDCETDSWRLIRTDSIDAIMQEELGSDLYILGCFNSWFLASVLDIDEDVIVSMQDAEAFEAIGKLIISLGKLKDLQEGCAIADGYGAHFSPYDGDEWEIDTPNGTYHAFRIN